MAKKQEKEPQKRQKSLYLTSKLWDKIDRAAKKENRSISNFAEMMFEKELA